MSILTRTCLSLVLLATASAAAAAASQPDAGQTKEELSSFVFPIKEVESSLQVALTHEEFANALKGLDADEKMGAREKGQKVAELLVRTTDKAKKKAVQREFSVDSLLALNSYAIVYQAEDGKAKSDCASDELGKRTRVCERIGWKSGGALAAYCQFCIADVVEACRKNLDKLYFDVALKNMEARDLQRISGYSRQVSELAAKQGANDKSLLKEVELIEEVFFSKAEFYRRLIRQNCVTLENELARNVFSVESNIWMLMRALANSRPARRESQLELVSRCRIVKRLSRPKGRSLPAPAE